MRVLLFSSDYLPDPGGIAAHVFYLSRALAELGVDVTVVGGHRAARERSPRSESANAFRELTIRRAGPKGIRAVKFAAQAYSVLSRLGREHWDVVHYHNFFPDGLLIGSWRGGRIHVFTNHSSETLEAIERGAHQRWFRFMTRHVHGVIAPSEELKESANYFVRPSQSVVYIPNGVDVEHFTPGANEDPGRRLLGIAPDRPLIVAVRRHDPKCGLPYLIDAMPAVLARCPSAVLCLVGDGVQTAALKQQVRERSLEQAVHFVGRLPHAVLPDVYRAASLSVLPSLYEAVSLSGLESLACACPVVGTNVGGIPEFLKHGETGMLVPPRNSSALGAAIVDVLTNPGAREEMGRAGRRLASARFSWTTTARATLAFYESFLVPRQERSTAGLVAV